MDRRVSILFPPLKHLTFCVIMITNCCCVAHFSTLTQGQRPGSLIAAKATNNSMLTIRSY